MRVLGVVVLFAIGFAVATRFLASYARGVERRDESAAARLRLIRQSTVLYSVVLEGSLAAAVFAAGVPQWVQRRWPSMVRSSGGATALIAVGLLLLIVVASIGAQRATAPSVRRIRGLEETQRQGAFELVRALAVFFLPFLAIIAGGVVFSRLGHGNGVIRGLGMSGAFLLVSALSPVTVRLSRRTYPAPPELRAHLVALCAAQGVRVRDVLLYEARRTRRANALFVGIVPSRRYVLVSDYLVDNFDGRELDAVMAHEICHGKEHHLVIKVGVLAAVIFLGGLTGFLFLVVYAGGPVLALIGKATEKRADDYAARTVGADAMIAALRHLAMLNDVSIGARSRTHPSIARRITRLGGELSPEEAESAKGDGSFPTFRKLFRGAKLPVRWRVALPASWLVMLVLAAVLGGDSGAYYASTTLDNIATAVSISAVFVVPVLAGFGWRWAPVVSMVGAAAGLVVAYADLQHPPNGGVSEFLAFGFLLVISVAATRDPKVKALTWERWMRSSRGARL
jgi:Zn-dependent protease with chaperone function